MTRTCPVADTPTHIATATATDAVPGNNVYLTIDRQVQHLDHPVRAAHQEDARTPVARARSQGVSPK